MDKDKNTFLNDMYCNSILYDKEKHDSEVIVITEELRKAKEARDKIKKEDWEKLESEGKFAEALELYRDYLRNNLILRSIKCYLSEAFYDQDLATEIIRSIGG